MASFSAYLYVAGQRYGALLATYGFTQATGGRGRAAERVRTGLVQLTLEVPNTDALLVWAATPYRPLAGKIVFLAAQGGVELETLSWEAGQCVGYREEFRAGDQTTGAYVCHLTIAAPTLTIQAGGPAAYSDSVAAAAPAVVAEAEATTELAASAPEVVAEPTLGEMAAELGQALLEELAPIAAAMATPAALTLGLILASSTPAGGPGIPQPHLLPVDPQVLRLNTLVAKQAAGTLSTNEEAELLDLLAKVKGIHLRSLADLHVEGPLKGNQQVIPGFYLNPLRYTKRADATREALRRKYESSVRTNFIKSLGKDPLKRARLEAAGLTDDQIDDMADGIQPDGYQVHHKLPLDDGGDNSFDNLVLIKNDPYHKAITNLQNKLIKGMKAGDTRTFDWPNYQGFVYP